MNARDVFGVLQGKGVRRLHHANSVTTSCTFLDVGGLVSRAHAVRNGLPQTSQRSDNVDQRYGVWNDIFTDTVDIHTRASNRIVYGPVLFNFSAELLLNLPQETEVLVTKRNVQYWMDGEAPGERYFASVPELHANLHPGDFGQAITFRNDEGIVPFGNHLLELVLDDPQIALPVIGNPFSPAKERLEQLLLSRNMRVPVTRRQCIPGCRCISSYRTYMADTARLYN